MLLSDSGLQSQGQPWPWGLSLAQPSLLWAGVTSQMALLLLPSSQHQPSSGQTRLASPEQAVIISWAAQKATGR